MRIAKLIIAGSFAALTAVATPALAKSSDKQKADEKSTTSPSCQAYQQAPDGSWTQLPCGEMTNGSTQHRPAPKSADDDSR